MRAIIEADLEENYTIIPLTGKNRRLERRAELIEAGRATEFRAWVLEVSDDLFKRWRAVQAAYAEVQDEIHDIVDIVHHD